MFCDVDDLQVKQMFDFEGAKNLFEFPELEFPPESTAKQNLNET